MKQKKTHESVLSLKAHEKKAKNSSGKENPVDIYASYTVGALHVTHPHISFLFLALTLASYLFSSFNCPTLS